MDLFTPVVEEARFHPNFQNILVRGRTAERDELVRWADGFPDRLSMSFKRHSIRASGSFTYSRSSRTMAILLTGAMFRPTSAYVPMTFALR